MDDDDRLLDYMQNRMGAEDRAAFEAEIARRPDLRAEIDALEAAVARIGAEPVPEGARDAGWDRLSAAIGAERPMPANVNRAPQWLKVASIVAASVLVWQVAVVPRLPGPDQGFVPASQSVEGPVLRVAFAEGAMLAEVSALLRDLGARVVDGPGAIGLYTLAFEDDAARDAAEAALAGDPRVTALSPP